jgi:hypothetical protein
MLIFLLFDGRIRIRRNNYGNRILEAQKHTDHYILGRNLLFELCLMLLALRPGLLVTARAEISAMVAPA